jgi:hypothetical protein
LGDFAGWRLTHLGELTTESTACQAGVPPEVGCPGGVAALRFVGATVEDLGFQVFGDQLYVLFFQRAAAEQAHQSSRSAFVHPEPLLMTAGEMEIVEGGTVGAQLVGDYQPGVRSPAP